MTREEIISEIKKQFYKSSTGFITQLDFIEKTKISKGTIRYHFGTWNDALEAADIEDPKLKALRVGNSVEIADQELLNDLYLIFVDTGKEPNEYLVKTRCRFPARIYKKKWGSISKAFLEAQKAQTSATIRKPSLPKTLEDPKEKKSILNPSKNLINPSDSSNKPLKSSQVDKHPVPQVFGHHSPKNKMIFGEPIHFRGVTYGPTNEQGVLSLFSMVSAELGFNLERIQSHFPKGEAKRIFDKENNWWEHVRLEFLYRSSEYKTKSYDINGCDLIVCWIHDWDECPLEILELKAFIAQN